MTERYKLREQLCISTLSVHCMSYNNTHFYDMRNRKEHNSFGFITNGSVEFSLMGEKVRINEGELFFVPEGIRYVSHWNGNPLIRFYDVHFLMPKKSVNLWRNMKLQRIDGVSTEKILDIIHQMCDCSGGDDADHLRAFGLFYEMLAMLLPQMQTTPTHNFPQPLQTAIAYIESNHATISSVREIASACFLSESRVYHLFQEHLGTSPISYLNHIRVHAAIEYLANPDLSIQQVAEQLNFHSEYYFRKTFQKVTGELPSKLRKLL